MQKSAGAIITYKGKLLMLLRDNAPNIPNPDRWQLIGGYSESGEEPMETLMREAKEEANIAIKKEEIREIGKIIVSEKQEYFLYWVELSEKEAGNIKLGNEGQTIEFIQVENLGSMKLVPALAEYLHKYRIGIEKLIKDGILDKESLGFDEERIYYINPVRTV